MSAQDIFYPTGFSLTELTAAINQLPHVPSQLGDLGLFSYAGVPTLTVQMERKGRVLELVGTKPRGSSGSPIGRDTRDLRSFVLPHMPLEDAILADEVQGVRAFGSENAPTPWQQRVMEVLQRGNQRFQKTWEWQRVGALKGIVYDADGSTVLYNFFTEFGVTPNTQSIALSSTTTEMRSECDKLIDKLDDELDGNGFSTPVALCGRDYWKALITHKSVKETYLASAAAAELRGNTELSFEFGGIRWVKYRGAANGSQMIAATKAYLVPTGVEGLLLGRFGPADYKETVNTIGMPMYAKGIEKRNGKGDDIEMQSNPMHFCTRPRAIIELTAS